ncbi:MAG TPA: LssY C-terminal domain-containing protein, partial [Candidatus Sulfopaludibacter sp.]|nr:LssY C-terminal domain-containing protein [Candidatus Sulfopaludibacter sp.]
ASMQLEFHELHMPDGRDYPVEARLTRVENARERVDQNGTVRGIRATATLSNRVAEHIVFALEDHPAAMIPLFVMETGIFHFAEPEFQYGRSAEMSLEVTLPAEFGPVSGCAMASLDTTSEEGAALQRVVSALPYWTYSKRQRQPLDVVNLVFAGPEDAVRRAFATAGWVGAQENSVRAGVAAIRAIAEENPFADAPMRTLLLNGKEPDIQLQKSLNTFEKRDHLRIWNRSESAGGRAVWASAATRDLGATFSMRPFGFTHEIENDVDRERDKVVRDLAASGCVESVTYLRRPFGLRAPGQVFRKGIASDERVAVLVLNACEQQRVMAPDEPPMRPPAAVRVIRRITLTARNHFLRDNIVYRSGDALRLGILALRGWEGQRRDEQRAASYYAQEQWYAARTQLQP